MSDSGSDTDRPSVSRSSSRSSVGSSAASSAAPSGANTARDAETPRDGAAATNANANGTGTANTSSTTTTTAPKISVNTAESNNNDNDHSELTSPTSDLDSPAPHSTTHHDKDNKPPSRSNTSNSTDPLVAPSGLTAGLHGLSIAANVMGLGNGTSGLAGANQPPPVLVTVPRLDDLIIKTLADNYHVCPAFDWIPNEYLDNVVNLLLPGKLSFPQAAQHVQCELFWKRHVVHRWSEQYKQTKKIISQSSQAATATATAFTGTSGSNLVAGSVDESDPNHLAQLQLQDNVDEWSNILKEHGMSYKRLYCELHIQELLQSYIASSQLHNYHKLLIDIEAAKPFIYSLKLEQLPSHIDLADLLFDFPNLHTLQIKFGAKTLGMDYDKSLFGMTTSDAYSLSSLLARCSSLTSLILQDNLISDELLGILIDEGLLKCHTLTHLDLSHNKITDVSMYKLLPYLKGATVLQSLNLSDNNIHGEGAKLIAQALYQNHGLLSLDLSLNNLGDEGGSYILNSLLQHETMQSIQLNACHLGPASSNALLHLIETHKNRTLQHTQHVNEQLRSLRHTNPPPASTSSSVEKLTAYNTEMNSVVSLSLTGGSSLRCLQLCSNALTPDGGAALLEALHQSNQIYLCDVRKNQNLNEDVHAQLKALMAKRLAEKKQKDRKKYQSGWDESM